MRKSLIIGGPCRDRTYDQLIKRDFVERIRRAFSTTWKRLSLSALENGARFQRVWHRVLEVFSAESEADQLKQCPATHLYEGTTIECCLREGHEGPHDSEGGFVWLGDWVPGEAGRTDQERP